MFYGAPPQIFERAKELRNNMTSAEQLLWERLNKNQLKGYRFRRQHPISNFIADFYCHSAKLVVEVDGSIHEEKDRKKYDEVRTEELNKFGVTVIRFSNKEVEKQIEKVIADISNRLA